MSVARPEICQIVVGSEPYLVLKQLGKGTYGQVYLVRSTTDQSTCAIKVVSPVDEETRQEADIMDHMTRNLTENSFFPKLIKSSALDHHFLIAMDAFPNHQSVHETCRQNLQHHYFRKQTILQIFMLVTYLHLHQIVHLDLSTFNVLLPIQTTRRALRQEEIKIIDFATARLMSPAGEVLGLTSHKTNVTTASAISPLTSLLYQDTMIPPKNRIALAMSPSDIEEFNFMSDLWSLFHLSCFFLNRKGLQFIRSPELLDHLRIEKVYDGDGHAVLPYLLFKRSFFFLTKKNIDVLVRYLCKPEYFFEYDQHFLLHLLDKLQLFNCLTYRETTHRHIGAQILGYNM
jgi:serine/threonine protein kinase